jgi:hypothetical protein
MAHHALIIHISEYAWDDANGKKKFGITPKRFEKFRAKLPEQFQPLLVGPIRTAANGDYVVAFLPDGSKEGWETSDEGDCIRAELAAMFNFRYEDGSTPFNVVEVRFGGDDPELGYAIDPRKVRSWR